MTEDEMRIKSLEESLEKAKNLLVEQSKLLTTVQQNSQSLVELNNKIISSFSLLVSHFTDLNSRTSNCAIKLSSRIQELGKDTDADKEFLKAQTSELVKAVSKNSDGMALAVDHVTAATSGFRWVTTDLG